MIKNRDLLILFLIALLSVSISMSVQRTETNQQSEFKIQTLVDTTSIHFDNIHKIELVKKGKQFVFEKDQAAWWQRAPFTMRMDSASMIALIETVQGLQVLGELLDASSLETLGLGDDATIVTLFDNEGHLSIRLGRKTLGGRAYAQLSDNEPVLVGQTLHRRAVDMDHRRWRDIRLFPDFAIDGTRIERNVAGERLLLERSDGDWSMQDPVGTRVDQDMLIEWVGKLAAASVGSFVLDEPHDLALFGLNIPSAIFETSDRNGNDYTLLIGGRVSAGSQDRYVMLKGQPVVFKMKWEILSQLFPKPEIFVDVTGSGVSRFDVKRFTIRSSGDFLQLHRELDRWVDSDGIPFDRELVNALLDWVLDAKSVSVAFAPYPRTNEVALIVFDGYDLAPLDTVRIALNAQGGWILENGDNVLRLHPEESGEVLTPFLRK